LKLAYRLFKQVDVTKMDCAILSLLVPEASGVEAAPLSADRSEDAAQDICGIRLLGSVFESDISRVLYGALTLKPVQAMIYPEDLR
jgi:hypothetical protein